MDNSLSSVDVSKLLSFGEGIIGEVVQETLEIFDSLENRTSISPSSGKGFSVRNGGFHFELIGNTTEPHPHASHPFVIEDPIDVLNNVARNAFQCATLQKVSQEALENLRQISVRPFVKSRSRPATETVESFPADTDDSTLLETSVKGAAIRNRVVQYAQAVKRTNTYTSVATTVRINTQWGEWSGEWGGKKSPSSKCNYNNNGIKDCMSRNGSGIDGIRSPSTSAASQSSYNKNVLLNDVFGISIGPSSL